MLFRNSGHDRTVELPLVCLYWSFHGGIRLIKDLDAGPSETTAEASGGGVRGGICPLDFGNILLNVPIILIFNNKWLWNCQKDLKNLKHIKILTFLAVLFFRTFISRCAINFNFYPPLKYFAPSEKIQRTPMNNCSIPMHAKYTFRLPYVVE